ncbi:tetratricopeptide repeat protein [Zobellia nedashkovskayae]|uniref:tetratricopeptide repeat-containing sensor histidine kinase n=1 Tax=Zobellia nedashkovskayae TaxID=2779510 RepID=UPI00188D2416|nr:tetratricopeptide repeat protein [Zobellia nedashkovskayae]
MANFTFGQTNQIETDFNTVVQELLDNKTTNYDSIHSKLRIFEKDTSKMSYLVTMSAKADFLEGESYGLHGIGAFLVHRSLFGDAIPYHEKGLEIAKKCNNQTLQIIHLNKLGAANRRTAKIKTAIDYYEESMKIAENFQNPSYETLIHIGRTINSMGSAHLILKQYNKSIVYYEKALKIQDSLNNKLGLAINNQNIGFANEELGNLDVAFEFYEKSLGYNEEIDSDLGRVICKNSIGRIYIKKGEYEKAEKIIELLVPLVRKTEDQFHIASVIINYGWVNLKLGNLDFAVKYLEEGLEISKKFELQLSLVETYVLLSDLESLKGNNEEALDLYKKSVSQREKVVNDQNISYLNELTQQLENEKKNNQLQNLANQNKIAEMRITQKQNMMSILIVSLLFGSILLWFSFNQRQKRMQQQLVSIEREQEVKTLESLMEGEEKERLRIAKELHDGVNGDLSAIKFKLSSLLEMNNTVIKEAVTMIDNSCEQVRAISHNLVPPSLKDFNLLEAVEEYCQSMDSIHEPEVNFQQVGEDINLDKKQEANLFRIVQELVTNSIKHAEGNEINVQLSHLKNTLQLTVEDNGKGFDPKTVKSDGIGMQNVQSRVDYLNATMDFVSNEKGTSYTITMDTKTKEP